MAFVDFKAKPGSTMDQLTGAILNGSRLPNTKIKPMEELITLYPIAKDGGKWEAQFSSQDVAQRFRTAVAVNTREIPTYPIRIHVASKSILVTRCPGDLSQDRLELLLFPPEKCGIVHVVSRLVEQSIVEGVPVCYTGRRFINIAETDFVRIKKFIPTHMVNGQRHIFVNYEGSLQQCYNCLAMGHVAKACPKKKNKRQRSVEQPPPPAKKQTINQSPASSTMNTGFSMPSIPAPKAASTPNPNRKGTNKIRPRRADPAQSTSSVEQGRLGESAQPLIPQDDSDEWSSTDGEYPTDRETIGDPSNVVQYPPLLPNTDQREQESSEQEID